MTDPTTRAVDDDSGAAKTASSGPGQWAPKGPLGQFLVYGAATAFAARLMALIAGIASQIFFARLIPPEALGAYFLTQSVVIMGANLGEFGLNRPIARVISVDVGANRVGAALRALRSAVGISTVTGLVVIAVFVGGPGRWLCLHVFDSELMANTIGFAGIWIAVRMVSNIGSAVLQGLHRVGLSALLSGSLSTTLIAIACGLLLLTKTEVDFETIIAIATGATAASAVLVVAMVWAAFSKVEPAGPSRTKPLMISTFPIFAAGILQVAAVQADLWIVGAQLQATDVALYGAAKRLTTLVGFPVMVLSFVVPPMISELYSRAETMRLQRLLRAATTAASIPATGALAIFLIFGTDILTIAYGEAYAPAATVLRILCAERIIFILLGPGSLLLVMTGNERTVFRITMVSATLSLLAIYLGGRFGGLVGVALGFSISSSLSGLWFFLEAHRQTGVWAHVSPLAIRPMIEVVQRMTRR